MWTVLGWLVAALLLGYVLGMKTCGRQPTLRERCAQIAVYRGRRVDEVSALLGGPAQDVQELYDGLLRTWRQGGYAITLHFDADDVCLGVFEEHD